jgi:hypothetical protein
VSDVAQLAVSLYSSSSYPANVLALAVAAVGAFMLLCLLAAIGEAAVTRSLLAGSAASEAPSAPDASHSTLAGLAVLLLACMPVALAGAWLLLVAMDNAPAVYTAPGPEASVVPRLAATVMPQLVVVGAAVLAAQAVGGRLLRAAIMTPPSRLGAALGDAVRDLGRRPLRWIGVAAVSWAKDAALFIGCWALLGVLWSTTADSLGPRLLERPQALLLLVGFVAIWLLLLAAGGVLHLLISAWRLLEEGDAR